MILEAFSNLDVSKSWITGFILFALVSLVTIAEWKKYKYSRALKGFKSFPNVPIIGTLYLILGDMQARVEKVKRMGEGTTAATIFWLLFKPIITLHNSQHIRQVSANNSANDRDLLGIFKNLLEDGILLSAGERWRESRRVIIRAFSSSMLKKYLIVFNQQSDILTKCLAKEANTGITFDLWQYMINTNLDTVVENMLGYKLHVQENGENEFSESVTRILELESRRVNNPLIFFNTTFKIYLYISGNKRWYKKANKLPTKLVAEKIRELKQREESDQHAQSKEEKPAKTLIDILLTEHQTNPEFDERRIRLEILNMIFVGSDTSAVTFSFILLFLAIHPEIQDKVYEEIQQVFKDGSTEVQLEHCNQMVYAEQCIKETLRIMSLVPLAPRRSSNDIHLDDGLIIPADSIICYVYYNVHHNTTIYPNSHQFDPDRFSPQNIAKTADHFMGFGVGRHTCIGASYAMISIKTQLVYVLQSYRLTSDIQMSDIVHIVDLLSRSKNGYPVKIWSR